MTSRQGWFRVWCSSVGHMLVFYFRHFAIGAYLLVIVAGIIGFARIESLAAENKQRISDIQESRLDSCRSTYRSFHIVFDPFLPPKNKQTAKQKKQIAKFNKIIDHKIAECRRQVTPPPIKIK